MIKRPTIRRGQGLLETIVALSVLITGVVAIMAMVLSASLSRAMSEYESIANNLAREGVEVVVAKRNANWASDQPFDTGLYAGTDYTFGAAFDAAANSWTLTSAPADGAPNLITDPLARIFKASSGLMLQGTPAIPQPPGSSVTIYRRLLTLDPICSDGTTEQIVTSGSSCPSGTNKIGIRVNSTVGWTEHGRSHSASAIETVYDWR
jgi:hypothetical protein